MHWDGSSWSVVTSPNVDPGTNPLIKADNKLYGITNVPGSSNLFWAVGARYDGSGNLRTLIMKGDTNSSPIWSVVTSANGATEYNCLRSVSAYDSDHVWAVGFQNDLCFEPPNSEDLPNEGGPVLLEKWESSSWTLESPPEELGNGTFLYGVSVASQSLVWAVGYDSATVVLRRDNQGTWTRRVSENPGPSQLTLNRLLGVDALSDTVAWAAGWYYAVAGGDKPTLIEHYVPAPTPTPTP
jgi:hypothetical protein